MVRKKIMMLMFLIQFTSCVNYYNLKKDINGEVIVNNELFVFNKKMTEENSKVIDTNHYYVELVDDLYLNINPDILIFHNDGTFELRSKEYFWNKKNKNSVYYGGKFLLEGNILKIESFYPSSGGRTNYFVKKISKGTIKNDTIMLTVFNDKQIYIKQE
ncbi:hypothetical protein [Flavobacterium sp. 22076]|uniref:hypothetical protein n=1 Tax=unclassified Flavobacterium TaxID=196869 RepID=UPI003F8364EB